MSSNHFPIDGQSVSLSRLNINEFSTNQGYKIQWGLYLRAQIKLQEFKPDDPLGYHGLAGILPPSLDFTLFLTTRSHSRRASQDVAGREIGAGEGILLCTCPVGLISSSEPTPPPFGDTPRERIPGFV